MYSTIVYSGSIAAGATATAIQAIPDQLFQVQGTSYFIPEDRKLLCAFAGGTGAIDVLMDSPTLQLNGRPSIYPIDRGTAGGNLPAIMRPGQNGLNIPGREQLRVLTTNNDAGAQQITSALWLQKTYRPAPPGPYKTIPFTMTGANGNLSWSLLTPTLTQGLMRGRYNCVGMALEGTNALFARLVFPQQVERPGIMCNVDGSAYTWDFWRNGNMGLLGVFDNDNIPMVEVFGTGTLSGTIRGYLDITPMPT